MPRIGYSGRPSTSIAQNASQGRKTGFRPRGRAGRAGTERASADLTGQVENAPRH
jgi:hypothetical protein